MYYLECIFHECKKAKSPTPTKAGDQICNPGTCLWPFGAQADALTT